MRNNLNISSLKKLKLGIASSCDLQFFSQILEEKNIFSEISYNFQLGSSDDAYIEMLLPNSKVMDSDILIFSVAESIKKIIHPIALLKNNDEAIEMAYKEYSRRLDEIFNFLKNNKRIKRSYIFTYPYKKYIWPLNDKPWIYGGLSYWINKIENEIYNKIAENEVESIDVISLDEALIDIGFGERKIRQEIYGGHPEQEGAELLLDVFLEKIVSYFDLENKIKLIALDLDKTILQGVFLESKNFPKIYKQRVIPLNYHAKNGIPIVIISKNNPEDVEIIKKEITSFNKKFVDNIISWKISWAAKSDSIKEVCKEIGISLSAVAFFDDNEFERQEVLFNAPEVKIYTEKEIIPSLRYAEFNFKSISQDAKNRVAKYKNNLERKSYEETELKTNNLNKYLQSLNFKISFLKSKLSDLDRMEELINRTNQQNLLLNRTPRDLIRENIENEKSFNIFLEDKFGDYGMIGTCIYENNQKTIELKELAISCRALGKSVEEAIIVFLNNYFSRENEKIEFSVTVNYKNKSFFEKFIENGFDFEENNSCLKSKLIPKKYPDWFKVITNL